ncbi:MAG: alpha-ketoacid dehydrogenase subunit beta [Candidatus Melainabacteria bacterium]|nr:alpha-ketoacid dehydrogenase subunit beta [Candidatus Melainabacteria bacterium]
MSVKTFIQAINETLHQEMDRDDRVVVLGEDVGVNGGVFRATEGLYDAFGADRVMDTPLSETGIVGAAIGMAVYGLKPVAEIQFADYTFPAFDQIVSELAKMRYRSGGDCISPVVVRTPYGGGIRGGHYHSQSPEAHYAHTPGLQVVIPSTPADAKGLLTAAIRGEDPVMFLEPKKLYRSLKGEVPDGEHVVPIGPARLVQAGEEISLFCYGAMVDVCQRAARKAADENGLSVEIIDLRTLNPLDTESILNSVRKTGRAVVVYEAPKTAGFGAEVAALIAEEAVDCLQAPVRRVAGLDTPFPYTLEHVYMPHPARVLQAIQEVVAYR